MSARADLNHFIRRIEDFSSPEMDDSWYEPKRMRDMFVRIAPLLHELHQLRMVISTYLEKEAGK